jgi:TPR repeat protein
MYQSGRGVARDFKNAMQYYRQAAEQDLSKALFRLGQMYYRGLGVPQDRSEAMKWYQKAAQHGHAKAQEQLRLMQADTSGDD